MPLLQEMNLVLNAIGQLLTSTGGYIAGFDIYYADNPIQPEKADYPWLDIQALDTEINGDVTDSIGYATDIRLRVYSKATPVGTGLSTYYVQQDLLNDLREWVVDQLWTDPRLINTAIYCHVQRISRLYIINDERSAGCFDVQLLVEYRRRP